MPASFDRRTALALLGATAAAPASVRATQAGPFQHGVASGDPDTTSIVLWTRVSQPDGRPVPVRWALAQDPGFTRVIASGAIQARSTSDHTVKVLARGLTPGERYYYRFSTAEAVSPTGRTRTLPAGAVSRLGIALVSCSNYTFGHFNAYAAIAEDPAIDLVLHTGDYIYEYGASGWGNAEGQALGRVHDPAHEIVSLDDYRRRHAQYKSDAGAQAMFAAHPFIACWDDHEVTNNPWTGGAQNHQPETEGDWIQRRTAALRAYFEWLPVREPGWPGGPGSREEFWRVYRYGDLATLVTLESRHSGRDRQVEYREHFETIRTQADRDRFMAEVIGDPARNMLSPAMEAALSGALSASVQAGQPWRILGNASPLARMLVPDLAAHGIEAGQRTGFDPSRPAGPDMLWTARWNLPFYTDTWDGYPAARERLYDLARAAGASDLLVLTGDSHSFWMNQLADGGGRPVGLELGTAGVTSPGDFVETGWPRPLAERLDRLFEQLLPEVVWTDNLHQGYVRVVLTPRSGQAEFLAVETLATPSSATRLLKSCTLVRGNGTLSYG